MALVASYFLGINPLTVLQLLSGGGMPPEQAPARHAAGQRRDGPFVSKVLASTEDTWTGLPANGRQYGSPSWCCFPA
jgi:predicted metalloprotease